MTRDLLSLAKEYGVQQNRMPILPQLAIDMLKAAVDGTMTRDDVGDVYTRYIAASRGVNPKTIDPRDTGYKANASKLRQTVILGETMGAKGLDVVTRALNVRDELAAQGVGVHPVYPLLVNVARAQLLQGRKPLTKAQLVELAKR
jgi:hypothetical protein